MTLLVCSLSEVGASYRPPPNSLPSAGRPLASLQATEHDLQPMHLVASYKSPIASGDAFLRSRARAVTGTAVTAAAAAHPLRNERRFASIGYSFGSADESTSPSFFAPMNAAPISAPPTTPATPVATGLTGLCSG